MLYEKSNEDQAVREKTKFQISIGCSESQEKSDIHFGDSMKIEKL